MTRSFSFTVPGSYTNKAGVTTTVADAYQMAYSKSDVVKTEAHKRWLLDKTVWLPPTPYEASVYIWGYRPAVLTDPLNDQAWAGHINFFGKPGHYEYAPDITGLYDEVINQVILNVKNSHVNLGAAFGEAEQTISLVAQSASRLHHAFTAAKHGNWKSAARELGVAGRKLKLAKSRYLGPGTKAIQEFSNRWLELQFGWKPLLSDLKGAAQTLAEMQSSDPPRLRWKASATKWRVYRYPKKEHIPTGGTLPWQDHYSTGDGRHGYSCTVWYAISSPAAVNAAALGLTNPLSVAWELTPFSFVADWILPIGNLIDTLDAYNGKVFAGGIMTEFYRVDAQRRNHVVKDIPQGHTDTTCSYLHWRYMNRLVLTDFPHAAALHFKNPLSVTHALDALALLGQTIRGVFH